MTVSRKKQRLDIKSPFWESRRYKEAQEAKAAKAAKAAEEAAKAKAAEEAAKAKPTEEEEGPSTPPGSSLDLMVSTGPFVSGAESAGGCVSWMWKMNAWLKAEQGLLRIFVFFKPRASCLLSGFPCFQKKLSGPWSLFLEAKMGFVFCILGIGGPASRTKLQIKFDPLVFQKNEDLAA